MTVRSVGKHGVDAARTTRVGSTMLLCTGTQLIWTLLILQTEALIIEQLRINKYVALLSKPRTVVATCWGNSRS